MPISKKWSKMRRAQVKKKAPTKGGVYELTSFGETRPLYIGATDNLERRLLEHLTQSNPNRFRYREASFFQSPSSMEKEHFKNYVSNYGEKPPWNTQNPARTGII